jgi:hypothetical protein
MEEHSPLFKNGRVNRGFSHPGDNFTPRRQSLPLGANFTPGAGIKVRPKRRDLKPASEVSTTYVNMGQSVFNFFNQLFTPKLVNPFDAAKTSRSGFAGDFPRANLDWSCSRKERIRFSSLYCKQDLSENLANKTCLKTKQTRHFLKLSNL